MFQSISCRLCINICNGHQRLYDADGLENEVYQLTEKYFTPMLLNMESRGKHLAVICLECWRHISEFHTFQQSVLLAQRQLVEVVQSRTEGPSLDEEQFSSSPPETLRNVVPHGNELRCAEEDTYDTEVLTNTTLLRDRINVSSNYKATPQQSEIEDLLDKDDFRTNPAQSIVTDVPPANECRSGEVDTYGSEIVKLYTAPTSVQDLGNVSLDAEDAMEAESSDDQDEEWEEFDDPVGIFVGGEFDNNENEINETVNRSGSGSDLSVEQFSSVDKMPLPEGADRIKDKTNAKKDYPEKVKTNIAHLATEIGGSAQSKSERTLSKDTSGKRIRNSALETMSESEWSDGGFSSEDDMPLIVLTRQGKVLAERDNPKEVDGNAKNTPQATIAKSNSNITCKRQTIQSCKKKLKHHKTVRELTVQPRQNIAEEKSSNSKEEDDNLEKENNKGTSQPKEYLRQPKPALEFDVSDFETGSGESCSSSSDSELLLADSGTRGNPEDVEPINGNKQNKTKRRRLFPHSNELNRPKTAEEFDEFISKWIPNLECVMCGDSSPCFTSLSQHFEKCHPNEKCHIVCCQQKFYRRYEIGKHILYHNTPRDFKCGACYKCFTTKYLLVEHMEQKHSGKVNEILKCPKCQKTYYSKQGLGRHLKYNKDCVNEKQRYTCSECGKDFKTRSILNKHKRWTHLGKRKECTCTVCDKVYTCAVKLREHMVLHTGGEDIYTCWYCPQTFRRTSDMYWHAKLEHPKERAERIKQKLAKASIKNTSHKCTICEKVYRTPFALKEHLATHASKNLYACLHCPNTYKYSSNLCAHMKRIHPNDYKKKKDTVDDLIKKYKLKAKNTN